MSNTNRSSSAVTQALRSRTLASFHRANPDKKEKGYKSSGGEFIADRIVGQVLQECPVVVTATATAPVPCDPIPITNFVVSDLIDNTGDSIWYPPYNIHYNFSWDPIPGATYTLTSDFPGDFILQDSPTSTTATVYLPIFTDNIRHYTLSAITSCGTVNSTTEILPCFLAGSLVQLVNGIKPIEDVQVNDIVVGAFGELNRVLALHRPLLGSALMCRLNDEHSTTNHHPHISIDRKFYCGNPDLVSQSTYGHIHKVIDADGNIVDRMLHGLKRERIQKLEIGVELKTIEGSRVTKTMKTYSMPEDTQLYNLVVDGSHTYHVDGYAVTGWPREDDFNYDTWS